MKPQLEKVFLKRLNDNGLQTQGVLTYKNREVSKTLELPWRDNKQRLSCIPKGTYKVVRRNSSKYGNHFHVTSVQNRSYILIHFGNYAYKEKYITSVKKQ